MITTLCAECAYAKGPEWALANEQFAVTHNGKCDGCQSQWATVGHFDDSTTDTRFPLIGDSEARQIQDRLLLLRCYGAIMAFRDPENRFPEDTGEFRELGAVADDIEKVLGITPDQKFIGIGTKFPYEGVPIFASTEIREPQPPDCAIPAPPDGFLMVPTVAYSGKLESEGKV